MNNIYLIGPMGCGKSTVGRFLAGILHRSYYDLDEEIVRQAKMSIPDIFQSLGETQFREKENQVIEALTLHDDIIVSTGGGSVINPVNRERLRSTGFVVYLQVSLNEQFKRISRHPQSRPLLQKFNSPNSLQPLNEQRESWYREIAHMTCSTDDLTPVKIAESIAGAYRL